MSEPRVTLNIDRLVLRGIDPLDQHALVDGLKTEMARVLADPAHRASLDQSRRTPVLRLGRMPLQPGLAGARSFGGRLGRAIVASPRQDKGGKR
jgi:hypothetical protein